MEGHKIDSLSRASTSSRAHAQPDSVKGVGRQHRWKTIMQHGIGSFIAEQPEAFQRRARRGIPMEYRWEVWQAAAGTKNQSTPGLYQKLLRTENQWTRLIEIDMPRTFPEIPLFDKDQQQSLLRILHAYANLNPDVGYCQGMNFVGGLLLLVSQRGDFRETPRLEKEEETFWMFAHLMEQCHLNGFYKSHFPLLRRYLWAFDELVEEFLPDLRQHFNQENVQHAVYLHQWFLTLFINCLPLPMVLVFWDVIICLKLEAILPITISLLKLLKDVLLAMQFEDIVRFFKTMRSGDPNCDTAAIGQMVVATGNRICIPLSVLEHIRAPVSPPQADGAICGEEQGSDSCPATGAGSKLLHGARHASAPNLGMEHDLMPGFTMGGYFRQHLGDISWDIPHAAFTWWEDARDSLQRVGLGVPSRASSQVVIETQGACSQSRQVRFRGCAIEPTESEAVDIGPRTPTAVTHRTADHICQSGGS